MFVPSVVVTVNLYVPSVVGIVAFPVSVCVASSGVPLTFSIVYVVVPSLPFVNVVNKSSFTQTVFVSSAKSAAVGFGIGFTCVPESSSVKLRLPFVNVFVCTVLEDVVLEFPA